MGSTPVASGHKAGITGLALDGTTSETWQLGSASAERWRLSGGTGASGVFALQNRRGGVWSDIWTSVDYGGGILLNALNGFTSLTINYDSTDVPQNVLTLTANKLTTTPGAGYGVSFTMQAEDSTTEYVGLGGAAWSWVDPTHASRSSKAVLSVVENAVSIDALTITGTGISTPALTLTGSQTANYVFAAPNGSAGAPSFRALVATDIPTLTLSKISDAGTMASQAASSVAITGGTINGTTIGATTATTGTFTTAYFDPASTADKKILKNGSDLEIWGSRVVFPSNGGNIHIGSSTSSIAMTPDMLAFRRSGGSFLQFINNTDGLGMKISVTATNMDFITGTNYMQNDITTVHRLKRDGRVGFGVGANDPVTILHAVVSSATTNSVENVLTIEKKLSSGTAAPGLGAGINLILQSSTTSGQNAARLVALWNESTHASRKVDLVGYASDASAEREIWRGRANGSAATIGFLGATPAARQTGGAQTATGTWTATEQGMLQAAYDALRTFGLLT